MAPKSSNGRLSRVGIFTEPQRQNLARPRRRDVYEFPDESPEKRPFRLPEKVNQKALKVVRKKKAQQEPIAPSSEPVQAPSEGHASEESGSTNEAPMPSSPPRANRNSDQTNDNGVLIEELFQNGAIRCAATSYRSEKPLGPRYEQCHNAGTNDTAAGPRCPRHAKTSGSVRCEYMMVQDGDSVQCRTAGVNGTLRCRKHAGLGVGSGSARKRKPVEDGEVHAKPSKSAKVHNRAIAGRKASNEHANNIANGTKPRGPVVPACEPGETGPKRQKPTTGSIRNGQEADVTESIEVTASASTKEDRQKRSKARANNGATQSSQQGDSGRSDKSQALARNRGTHASDETHDRDSEDDEQGHEEDEQDHENSSEHEEGVQTTDTSRALRRVFKFLDLKKRSGHCETKLCLEIKTVCKYASRRLRQHDLEVEEMAGLVEKVRTALDNMRSVARGERVATKADVYGYIFRWLIRVLQSLYGCWDGGADTLEVVRILTPFVRTILTIKDLIASWKVTVNPEYDGDRNIQDVNIHLIAPLRKAEAVLTKRLQQLESKERVAKDLAAIERQIEEMQEEQQRLERSRAAHKKRWAIWQQLHIARMQCEPDLRKRMQNLAIIKLERFEETDADGVQFQRLPVFKDRETPPRHHALSAATLKPWSTKEEQTLLYGLQKFSGNKDKRRTIMGYLLTRNQGAQVLQKTFQAYCGPPCDCIRRCNCDPQRGLLRKFRVLDIVTKIADLRSTLFLYYEQEGFDIPEWVKKIPVLP
jgi:hypothetical protein